jgi:hypothetical protein
MIKPHIIISPTVFSSINSISNVWFIKKFKLKLIDSTTALHRDFEHLRPYMAIDACYTMSRYSLALVIAAVMDENCQIVPMDTIRHQFRKKATVAGRGF